MFVSYVFITYIFELDVMSLR